MGAMAVKPDRASAKEEKASGAARTSDKIDFYCHFSSLRVIDYLEQAGGGRPHMFRKLFSNTPTLIDVDCGRHSPG